MSQVSKRKIEPKVERELLDSLSYIFKELKTKNEVDKFLSSALSKNERLMVAKRVLTAYLLDNGVEETKVAQTLKLTNATITRFKMWIELNEEGFNLVFKKLRRKSAEDLGKHMLNNLLKYVSTAAFGKVPNPFKTP